jgi:elongation factor G
LATTADGAATVDAVQRGTESLGKLPAHLAEALLEGINIGLKRGVLMGSPLIGVDVSLRPSDTEWDTTESNQASFRAAACLAVQDALRKGNSALLEPIMHYKARLPPDAVGDILSDLTSKRRAAVHSVENVEGFASRQVVDVVATVPLAALVGYSSWLRANTKGVGTFSTDFAHYAAVTTR